MPQPEVLSGMRAPRSTRMDAMTAAAEASQAHPNPAPGADPTVTVYVSKYRRYRVQITAPQTFIGPDGRKTSGGKMLVAEFDEGIFRNRHRDPAIRKLIDESLQTNPYFGPFGSTAHYWLASEQQAKTEAASIARALATLKSIPKEALEQHMAALKQGEAVDFELPSLDAVSTAGPVGKITRPIPPLQ